MTLHQRMMRNGWMIPNSMEWLFWPIGYKITLPADVVEDEDGSVTYTTLVEQTIQLSLARRFRVTNEKKFMAVLEKLGVVKEAKP